MSYAFTQKWYRTKLAGLGSTDYIGPDQPWTAANASQWITQRTRQCETGKEIVIGGPVPPNYVGGKKIQTENCYATGRVKESAKAGFQRVQEWCCPSTAPVQATRQVTQEQAEQQPTLCDDKHLTLPSGQVVLTHLGWWLHKDSNIPTALCRDSGVRDGDYKLLCCRDPDTSIFVVKDGKTYVKSPAPTTASGLSAEQIAQRTAEVAAAAAESEAVMVAAQEPQAGFFQRYGLVLALGAGAIGIGVVAGLIKRKRLNKKSEG